MRNQRFTWMTALAAVLFAVTVVEAQGPPEGKGRRERKDIPEMDSDAMKDAAMEDAEAHREAAAAEAESIKDEAEADGEDSAKGLEKQRERKRDQVRKEMEKGSEKGQAMRKEKSRKWWTFWDRGDSEEEESAE